MFWRIIFIQDVLPKEVDVETRNYVEISAEINNNILDALIDEVTENCEYKLIRCDDCNKEAEIMDNYWQELEIWLDIVKCKKMCYTLFSFLNKNNI